MRSLLPRALALLLSVSILAPSLPALAKDDDSTLIVLKSGAKYRGVLVEEVHGDHVIIPAERMKGKNGRAREHLVPLSSTAQEVIASLPRYRGGRYLFSFSAGERPVAMATPAKRDLDRRMLRTLKAMAHHRGEDHDAAVTLPNWTNHDLRRVVRSGLSQLRVAHNVAEAILAHKAPGIVGTYDVHDYQDEKREALELWAQHLAKITNPTPAKVINLRERR